MTTYTQDMVHLSTELHHHVEHLDRLQQKTVELVKACRDEGMTWGMVGIALGTSSQAAWERYGLTPEQKRQRHLAQLATIEQLTLDITT